MWCFEEGRYFNLSFSLKSQSTQINVLNQELNQNANDSFKSNPKNKRGPRRYADRNVLEDDVSGKTDDILDLDFYS